MTKNPHFRSDTTIEGLDSMKTQNQIQQVVNILGEPVVFDAIAKLLQIEKEKCLKKINRLKSELTQYEKQFSISSKEAWGKYQSGTLGDDFDVMEWMALFQNLMSFQEQYERITEFNL